MDELVRRGNKAKRRIIYENTSRRQYVSVFKREGPLFFCWERKAILQILCGSYGRPLFFLLDHSHFLDGKIY